MSHVNMYVFVNVYLLLYGQSCTYLRAIGPCPGAPGDVRWTMAVNSGVILAKRWGTAALRTSDSDHFLCGIWLNGDFSYLWYLTNILTKIELAPNHLCWQLALSYITTILSTFLLIKLLRGKEEDLHFDHFDENLRTLSSWPWSFRSSSASKLPSTLLTTFENLFLLALSVGRPRSAGSFSFVCFHFFWRQGVINSN